ncbi:MAG: hypothetical protein GY772_01860, partial [bacterium]|nr:hypothetical protein [bacterium]
MADGAWRVHKGAARQRPEAAALTSYLQSADWDGGKWPKRHFDVLTSPGAELTTLTGMLRDHLQKAYPDLYRAFAREEPVTFPLTMLIGSALSDACAGGDAGTYLIRPLPDRLRYYQRAIEELSKLLHSCQRAFVAGFGTAQHRHLPPNFNNHADHVADLLRENRIPIWDGMARYQSIAHFRTRVDKNGALSDWFRHFQEQDGWALPRRFESTLL